MSAAGEKFLELFESPAAISESRVLCTYIGSLVLFFRLSWCDTWRIDGSLLAKAQELQAARPRHSIASLSAKRQVCAASLSLPVPRLPLISVVEREPDTKARSSACRVQRHFLAAVG